jgi:hypothetical protein
MNERLVQGSLPAAACRRFIRRSKSTVLDSKKAGAALSRKAGSDFVGARANAP